MEIHFDQNFNKDLNKLKNTQIKNRLLKVIEKIEEVDSIESISSVKKLTGYESYFRIRIGDYRIGCELIDQQTLLFITIMHRKDIYNNFP